ncbi:MAG: 30S ribosomal protein S4 [Candidatus Lindowbacteria bacterium RIFCSPLOWO2_12_FULL_62_27]|nr:MAG: 30S ribosomal protein S4 [Candidatus Lindowbacteria bacterium RIFCSPLOWO2_12_FULL_62_27]OGH63599.1 MAG: 30S ribosomal protein S4 [Candidatus Lindowbacteria bacterium RIFCSPLOWO2_02_FULL_62_12]
MGRHITSVCVLCRRERVKLYLKGNRCLTSKCAIEQKRLGPGQHGAEFKKVSDYGMQLREKQKLRRYYLMMERPFLRQFMRAVRTKGKTGEVFLRNLELRLDSVVFRLGLAPSRRAARQIISHGHVAINNRKVDVPSAQLRVGDVVKIREGHNLQTVKGSVEAAKQRKSVPEWLDLAPEKLSGKVIRLPERTEIPVPVQEQQIVEFYSK